MTLLQVLAELATLFLDTDFCNYLRESTTPEAFLPRSGRARGAG